MNMISPAPASVPEAEPARKTIIFDFDGTIADTLEAAVGLYNGIADQYRCKKIDPSEIPYLKSRNPRDLLKSYGVTKVKLPFLIVRMRRELHDHITEIKPIAGMFEAVRAIKDAGFPVGVLTSNSRRNVLAFLKKNEQEDLFDFVVGDRHLLRKDKGMVKLLARRGLTADGVVYVGDETRDVEASKRVGIPIISVTWGFNSRAALEPLAPARIAETPEEVVEWVKGL